MKQEDAQKTVKLILQKVERELTQFLEIDTIEKLETISNSIKNKNNPLSIVLTEIIPEWKKVKGDRKTLNLDLIEKMLGGQIGWVNEAYYKKFLHFGALLYLFGSRDSALSPLYRRELLKKHKLTPQKLKTALLDVFGDFITNIKHGGSKSAWDDTKKLEFLATYNRFLIVIQNARRDFRVLKKQLKSEAEAKKQLIEKYEVHEELMLSLFSVDTASELALDWAIDFLDLENFSREYLDKRILKEARNLWKDKGILIDIYYAFEIRKYYGINSDDKNIIKSLKDDLKYTPLIKTPDVNFDQPMREKYLVEIYLFRE